MRPGTAVLLILPTLALTTDPVALRAQEASAFRHRSGTEIRRAGQPLDVTVVGTGPTPVVAISGHSHGAEYFESLTARLRSEYTFHIVVPPGMGGTAAYPWPTNAGSLEGEEWTSRFVNDLRAYVTATFTNSHPVLLAGWDAGLGQAIRALEEDPALWRSALLVGSSPYYIWYRPTSADGSTGFDLELQRTQRLPSTMRFWQTVPESTWHRNTYPAGYYTADATLGERLKAGERARPFEVVLRYFAEYLHGDHVSRLRRVRVPVVAIAPTNAWLPNADASAREEWQVSHNDCVQVHVAPSDRYMTRDDHPEFFDALPQACGTNAGVRWK